MMYIILLPYVSSKGNSTHFAPTSILKFQLILAWTNSNMLGMKMNLTASFENSKMSKWVQSYTTFDLHTTGSEMELQCFVVCPLLEALAQWHLLFKENLLRVGCHEPVLQRPRRIRRKHWPSGSRRLVNKACLLLLRSKTGWDWDRGGAAPQC